MKCPFRTVVTKEAKIGDNPFDVTYGKVVKEVETIDFAECVGEKCPFHYYGAKVSTSSGYAKTQSIEKCKRAEE